MFTFLEPELLLVGWCKNRAHKQGGDQMRTSHQSEILHSLYFTHLTVALIESGVTRQVTLMILKVTLIL